MRRRGGWCWGPRRGPGRGGTKRVAEATGAHPDTVARGRREVQSAEPQDGRIRRPGAGRRPLVETDPGLLQALEALVEPETRGDPMSPLKWTTKSTRNLAEALAGRGHQVSASTVATMLTGELGYSLQGNAKTIEGKQHPDRDAQFGHLNAQAEEHMAAGCPVISVDTKKKELVGRYKNGGREWQPSGEPEQVNVHDFVDQDLGKAVPYGVYDVAANTGWVNVGTDHDTSQFAVQAIRRWWDTVGKDAYPDAETAADLRRRRRLQRPPDPIVEDRAGRARRRDRAGDQRVPPPTRDLEVEQNRAPAVLPHLHELARASH